MDLILTGLTPLLLVIGLALVSCTPGPPGVVAAGVAISYDIKQKRWYGIVLSAASVIPVIGYVPAVLKVGALILELKRHLDSLVVIAPEIRQSPEALQLVRSVLGEHYKRLPNNALVRPVRKQLEEILDLDSSGREKTAGRVR